MTALEFARRIDHTLLRPEATGEQIDRLCDECLEYGFHAACVNPVWVERCAGRLGGWAARLDRGSNPGDEGTPRICSVAGFPLGAALPDTKADEARRACEQGAGEIDMVVNLGALIAGDRRAVVADIAAVVDAVKRISEHHLVKVILETAALTQEQIILGCRCAAEAQADFVKTSTGFHPAGGARLEHVALLRRHAAPIRVKAAGGIRDLATALAMIEAGADRLGMSASVAVIRALGQG